MHQQPWYKKWFNSPYYDLLYDYRNEEEARSFIDLLIKYLQPEQHAKIVDVACRKGRHSKVLADMGFDVTGIDLSENSIVAAKIYENEHLHFFVHDMRQPFYINYFDIAFNFFTSFGYFDTKREHNNIIRAIVQSLRTNGIFLIDYLNVHYAENNLVKNEERISEKIKFSITRWQDDLHFYKQIKVTDKNKNFEHSFTERVAKFTLDDFTEMLAQQNLQVKDVFGNYELEKYHAEKSPRMIIVSKKID